MKRRLTLTVSALAVCGAVLGFVTAASGHPTQTSACTGCHGSASKISLSVKQVSNNGTSAQYQITVSGGSGSKGYAVLSGSTNVAHASAASGVVTLPVGKTYTVWAVDTSDGARSTSVSPVAPAPAPTPTPAPTPAPDPTTTPTPTPAPVPSGICRLTVHVVTGSRVLSRITVTAVNTATGARFVVKTNSKGNAVFATLLYGTYRVVSSGRSTVRLTKPLVVGKTSAKLTMRVRMSRHSD